MNPVLEAAVLHQELTFRYTERILTEQVSRVYSEITSYPDNKIQFVWLGRQNFSPVWDLQKMIHSGVSNGECGETVLFVEHEHVYTFGKNANHDHLLPSSPPDAQIIQTDRGGDITYHGPGQLVMYPIIDLHNYRMSISWYMRMLEELIIQVLQKFGISSGRKPGLTGVWVEDEKVCAMGVRLSRWITMHGLALNIDPQMEYFHGMIRCGIFDYGVTSIFGASGKKYSVSELIPPMKDQFCILLERSRRIKVDK